MHRRKQGSASCCEEYAKLGEAVEPKFVSAGNSGAVLKV